MKKVIVVLFLVSFILLGAVNPGLPKDDLKFIKQFRLPAWKYSGFGITLNGNGENTGFTLDNSYRHFENYDLIFSPNIQGRRESETEILEYNGDLNMYYNYLRHDHSWDMGQRIKRTVNINPYFNATLKKYQYDNSYLNMETDLNYNYMHIYEDKYNESNDRLMSASLTIGLGNGKVREVTPVIRALRFKQRYNSLVKGKLSQQEVADLAKIMAKYPGYNYTYERSEKYFWNEAFSVLGDKITGLNGYETFMITDAMQEMVGTRLQGREFNVNIEYEYMWMDYNGDYDFEDYTTAYIGPVMNARSYENLSVSHQVGFEIYIDYFIPTSDIEPFENMFNCWLNHNQLFTITDRLFYQVDFNFYGDIITYNKVFENKGIKLEALNNFSYYLENNLSLNLNTDVHFQKYDHQISDYNNGYYYYPPSYYYGTYREYLWWDFGISLNYYFRKM